MSYMTTLEVVNECLGTLGELPINSLEEGHPDVPAALRALKIANRREQSKSWWFNRELVELSPATDGFIYLPNDVLKVDPESASDKYVQRGRRLYKPYESNVATKYVFTQPVTVWLVREVPFEDCPYSAQSLINYSAQLDFTKTYEADRLKYEQVLQLYKDAVITINSEHVRAQGVNMLNRRAGVISRSEIGAGRVSGDYRPHS